MVGSKNPPHLKAFAELRLMKQRVGPLVKLPDIFRLHVEFICL